MAHWIENNRRRESGVVHLWPVMKWIGVAALLASGAMLVIWQQTQNVALARSIEECRLNIEKKRRDNVQLGLQIAQLEKPEVLEWKNQAWRLGLVAPTESQIVRVGAGERLAPVPQPGTRTLRNPGAVALRR
jgi:hypothetical protein